MKKLMLVVAVFILMTPNFAFAGDVEMVLHRFQFSGTLSPSELKDFADQKQDEYLKKGLGGYMFVEPTHGVLLFEGDSKEINDAINELVRQIIPLSLV